MDEYRIEQFSKEKVNDLFWLFNKTTKLKTTLSEFRRKYDTSFTGVSYVGYMAYDTKNRPAAFYGILPTVAIVDNKRILIAQSADTRTHPKHQRKGLFVLLAKKTYELAKEKGIEFIYGVANENSFPGFIKKLNWKHVGNLKEYKTNTLMIPFAQFFRFHRLLKNVYQLWVSFIILFYNRSEDIHIFNQSQEDFITIQKDSSYFQYKNSKSVYLLRIKNQLVWLKFEGVMMIGDIELGSPDEQKSLIKKLKTLAWFTGINKIKYFTSDNHPNKEVLHNDFQVTEGSPIIVLSINSNYNYNNLLLSNSDIDTF